MSNNKQLYNKIVFKQFLNSKGLLMPLEFGKSYKNTDVPFNVKRTYIIVPQLNHVRGKHAHKHLEQVIICIQGFFTLVLDDGLNNKERIKLYQRHVGIHIKGLLWRELESFSDDCIILVFASQHYSENDYIRDYKCFLKEVKSNNISNKL